MMASDDGDVADDHGDTGALGDSGVAEIPGTIVQPRYPVGEAASEDFRKYTAFPTPRGALKSLQRRQAAAVKHPREYVRLPAAALRGHAMAPDSRTRSSKRRRKSGRKERVPGLS